jgi:hypothetical protein
MMRIGSAALGAVGLSAISLGVWMISHPGGLALGGVLLLVLALCIDKTLRVPFQEMREHIGGFAWAEARGNAIFCLAVAAFVRGAWLAWHPLGWMTAGVVVIVLLVITNRMDAVNNRRAARGEREVL